MKIIGRSDEQNILNSCLKSSKLEFLVVYGVIFQKLVKRVK